MYCRRVESAKAAGVKGAPPTMHQVVIAPVPIGENIKSLPTTIFPLGVLMERDAKPRTVLPIDTGALDTIEGAIFIIEFDCDDLCDVFAFFDTPRDRLPWAFRLLLGLRV